METLGAPLSSLKWPRPQRKIACQRCRQRKKKCDKKRPICGECSKFGARCEPLVPKRNAASKDPPAVYVHLLEAHVASLETRLRQSHPNFAADHLIGGAPSSRLDAARSEQEAGSPVSIQELDIRNLDPERQRSILRNQRASLEPDVIESPLRRFLQDQEVQDQAFDPIDDLAWMPDDEEEMIMQTHFDMNDSADILPLSQVEAAPQPTVQDTSNHVFGPDLDADNETVDEVVEHIETHQPSLHRRSMYLADHQLHISSANRYASEYFSNAHPMWPFLHQTQWQDYWNYWSDSRVVNHGVVSADWKLFFVDMVVSVGALLAQYSKPSPEHAEVSKFFFQRALSKQASHDFQNLSPLIATQSSLLLTIHALHSDSVTDLFDRASAALQTCVFSGLNAPFGRRQTFPGQHSLQDTIRRQVVRSCYVIDILISNSMEPSMTFVDPLIEDVDPSDDDDDDDGSHSSDDIERDEHAFRLRRIQFCILKATRKVEAHARQDGHPVPNLWRSNLSYDLNQWLNEIATCSAIQGSQKRFQSAAWLLKLAGYTTISLFPNPYLAVRSGDARHLVSAACKVLVTFRHFKIKENVSCYTWTALQHQFQAGVTIAYCLWATPTHQQPELYERRAICQALFACSSTLVEFATKWETAKVFRDCFELLTEAIPPIEFGDPSQQWSMRPRQSQELREILQTLEKLRVQHRVIDMLDKIAQGPRPTYHPISVEETQWIQYEHRDNS